MQSYEHNYNISLDIQNNIFNNIMSSRILCIVSINNEQLCLQMMIVVLDHEHFP